MLPVVFVFDSLLKTAGHGNLIITLTLRSRRYICAIVHLSGKRGGSGVRPCALSPRCGRVSSLDRRKHRSHEWVPAARRVRVPALRSPPLSTSSLLHTPCVHRKVYLSQFADEALFDRSSPRNFQ